MAQEKEKSKVVNVDDSKFRRREKLQRDLDRRRDKFDKGAGRKR